jgi:hypothetical protein
LAGLVNLGIRSGNHKRANSSSFVFTPDQGVFVMAKPSRKLKKANHGKRPANSKARKAKRRANHT